MAAVLGGAGAGEPAGAGAGPAGGLPPLPAGQVRLPGLVHGAQPQQRGQLRLHTGVWILIVIIGTMLNRRLSRREIGTLVRKDYYQLRLFIIAS